VLTLYLPELIIICVNMSQSAWIPSGHTSRDIHKPPEPARYDQPEGFTAWLKYKEVATDGSL